MRLVVLASTVAASTLVALAQDVRTVTVPQLHAFLRPTVDAERVATWRKDDALDVAASHIDDQGVAWVRACRDRQCGWVEAQSLDHRAEPPVPGDRRDRQPAASDRPAEGRALRVRVDWQRLTIPVALGGVEGGQGLLGAHLLTRADSMPGLELPATPGALVWALIKGGAAERAGLRMLDVVTHFDGRPVSTASDLVAIVKAARPGRPVELAVLRPDVDAAIRQVRPQCDRDNAEACASLGLLQMSKQAWGMAFQWVEKAARLGNVAAMLNLAGLYEHGLGVAQSRADAIRWYVDAADRGSPLAVARLGALGVSYKPKSAPTTERGAASPGDPLDGLPPLEPLEPIR